MTPLGRSHHSRALCVFAVGHKAVQITLRSQTAQLLVGFAGQLAQLQHIAQQGKAALAGEFLEHGKRGLHAVGVCIVAILNDGNALAVHHLLAAAGLLKIESPLMTPRGSQPKRVAAQ